MKQHFVKPIYLGQTYYLIKYLGLLDLARIYVKPEINVFFPIIPNSLDNF